MSFHSSNSAFSAARPYCKAKAASIESSAVERLKDSSKGVAAQGVMSGRCVGKKVPGDAEKLCQTVFELQKKLIPTEAQISTSVVSPMQSDTADDSKRKFTFKPGSIPQIIDYQRGRLHIRNQIGMGNFANVFSVSFTPRDSTDQRNVAMKINKFEHKSEENQYLKSSIEREVHALRKISDYVADSGKESFIAECLFSDDLGPYFHFMIMPMYSTDLKDLLIRNKLLFAEILNIKTLARQLFQALDVLASMNPPVIHCDVKPANIMVESVSPLKIRLSDFGCCEEGNKQNQESDYIVTRWYRPPEIVLGCPYGPPVDMWGVGCTLFETHTRNYLFAGDSNRHMFYLHAGLIGPIPISFFESIRVQTRTRIPVVLIENQYHFTFDENKFNHLLLSKQKFDHFFPANSSGSTSSEGDSSVSNFREFLKNIFTWSPEERLTPSQALMHPFLAIP